MVDLNIVDRGGDDATLEYIIKSLPVDALDEVLRSCGYEVQVLEPSEIGPEYEPLDKGEIMDLIKARKIKAGLKQTKSGKTVSKVMKRIIVHPKNGKTYMRNQMVNAGVAEDAPLQQNVMQRYDAHVAKVRTASTAHITEMAPSVEAMTKTPEGRAALDAINKAIGTGSPSGKLTTGLSYTDIRYCTNPVASYDRDGNPQYVGCVAIAKNPKTGVDQYFYTQQFREESTAVRAQRAMVMASPAGSEWLHDMLADPSFADGDQDIKDCIQLMYDYGMKSGNEKQATNKTKHNQAGKYLTVGATTLTAGNIYIEPKKVLNKETGKTETVEKVYIQHYQQGEKGDMAHQQSVEVTDPALAARLKARKEQATSDDARIFGCSKEDTLAVCKETLGCTNEDLRSAFGFRAAREGRIAMFGKNPFEPKKTTRKNAKTGKTEKLTATRAKQEVREYIKEQLGVTDNRMADKFINPKVIDLFFKQPKNAAGKARAQAKGTKKP